MGLGDQVSNKAEELKGKEKQVLFIWLDGGMSQLESWDPKRDFAYAMLHAERLTRMLADVTISRSLIKQAEKFPERRELARAVRPNTFHIGTVGSTVAQIREELQRLRGESVPPSLASTACGSRRGGNVGTGRRSWRAFGAVATGCEGFVTGEFQLTHLCRSGATTASGAWMVCGAFFARKTSFH